jgi:hypothetical protein
MKFVGCLVVFFTLILAKTSLAQNCYKGFLGGDLIDSNTFESNNSVIKTLVDTTWPNNIWQIGSVSKVAFGSANSGIRSLQTDSLSPYPALDSSAVIVFIDSVFFQAENGFSISFWHKFDTDTLKDLCLLQITNDSGKTWATVRPGGFLTPFVGTLDYTGSLNKNGQSLFNDSLMWSGTQTNWVREQVCITFIGLKGVQIPKTVGYRFLFVSDSMQTNKAGWIIDDIQITSSSYTSSIRKNAFRLQVLPNPVLNKQLHINYPNALNGTFELFNIYGKRVLNTALAKDIDLPNIPAGVYFYNVKIASNPMQVNGKLIIE